MQEVKYVNARSEVNNCTSLYEQRESELILSGGSTPINRRDVRISRRGERITVKFAERKLHMVPVPLLSAAKVTDESTNVQSSRR